MKHASASTLQLLHDVLDVLREMPEVTERKPGIFYKKSSAFLHFHEDPEGIFADVKLSGKLFDRFPVNTSMEKRKFLQQIAKTR